MSDLRKTPLYNLHAELGARFVPFSGWEMPVQYAGILAEHLAVRESVGIFDVSHMGEARVSGSEAEAFLDYLLTNDLSKLKTGRALYTMMCYPDGGVVDDLIVYRTGPTEFLLCINAGNTEKDIAWILEQAGAFDCVVRDVSGEYAQIALQGPKALAVLKACAGEGFTAPGRFAFCETEIASVASIVCRTGYTGEDGVEIFCPADGAEALTRALFATEADGVAPVPCGLGARDSLRLEAGYPLYGHEISDRISPLQAGLGWTVKLKKARDFIGKAALEAEKIAGPSRQIVHFRLSDRRIARPGTPVLCDGETVGEVVSGTQSPVLKCPIGAGLVAAPIAGSPLYVDLRGNRVALEVAAPPLHQIG